MTYIYIGYLIGTYLGVYFKISPLFLFSFFCIFFILLIFLNKQKSNLNLQIFIKKYSFKLFIIMIIAIIAMLKVKTIELKREQVFKEACFNQEKEQETKYIVKITNKENLEYSNRYTGLLIRDKDNYQKKAKLIFNTKEKLLIAKTYEILGELEEFKEERNYKGFNEKKYYYSKRIDFKLKLIDFVEVKTKKRSLYDYIILTKEQIYKNIDKGLINKELFKALFLGNSTELEEDIKINFKSTNVYHVLAMSGMHISYLVLILNFFLKQTKLKINFKFKKGIQFVILIFYMLLVGISSSISRAVFLVLIALIFKEYNLKYGFINSILLSIFIIFIINPYTVYNIGFYLSYVSAISIYLFLKVEENAKLFSRLTKHIKNKYFKKIIKFIFYNIYISLIVYLSLLPLLMYFFGEITFNFFIANLLLSSVLPVLMILGFVYIFLILAFNLLLKFNIFLAKSIYKYIIISLVKFIDLLLELLTITVKKASLFNIAKKPFYYVQTPNIIFIIIFYVVLYIFFYVFARNTSKFSSSKIYFQSKYKDLKRIILRKKFLYVLILIVFIFSNIFIYFTNNWKYKIAFLYVGQGDSSFIITPENTTILIDAGSNQYFDNGKEIRRYIFARKKIKIDHLFVSHFDIDHIGGVFTLIESVKINKIYIPKYVGRYLEKEIIIKYGRINNEVIKKIEKNIEEKKKDIIEEDFLNYYLLKRKAKQANIPIIELKRGDSFALDKATNIEVLFPVKDLIINNFSNNNSLVFKINCISENIIKNKSSNKENDKKEKSYAKEKLKEFSILYTGDIEKEGMKRLLDLDNANKNSISQNKRISLKSDILKVPHHGSKYSLNEDFFKRVSPSISVISSGENNIYGHPHKEVIIFFKNLGSKIYRTDISGEIFLEENTIFSY